MNCEEFATVHRESGEIFKFLVIFFFVFVVMLIPYDVKNITKGKLKQYRQAYNFIIFVRKVQFQLDVFDHYAAS